MNKIFKQLRDDNLLLPIEGKRGKYELTEKAIIIIKDMEKLEDKIGEIE
jgi:predicted transcriptional regulator